MFLFEVNDNVIVNLERLGAVQFQEIDSVKNVVITVDGVAYIVPSDRHKDLFTKLFKLNGELTKQFVAL